MTPRLDLRGLSKTYAAPALLDASLVLEAGEVHALVGENGAGKSTLARIVAGLTAADAGHMRLDGIPYAPRSRREAVGRGVRMVLQELSVLPTLTVAENIFLAHLPHRFGVVDRPRLREHARRIMETLALADIDPDAPAGGLGIGRQQLVEIAAALVDAPRATPCRLLVLDEPTAALTRAETAHLFAHVRRLRATGTTIVYISHRLEELAEVADRVTVLRDGAVVATAAASALAPRELVRLMVGRAVDETPRDRAAAHVEGDVTTKRIVVVGSLNADLVVRLPRFPRPGETLAGESCAQFPGGKGANQACAAARRRDAIRAASRTTSRSRGHRAAATSDNISG